VPPPGLVPPVILYWVELPTEIGLLTVVFKPDEVMGAAAWDGAENTSEVMAAQTIHNGHAITILEMAIFIVA